MMRLFLKLSLWLRRLVVLSLALGLILGGPVAYVEFSCGGTSLTSDEAAPPPAPGTVVAGFAGAHRAAEGAVRSGYASSVASGDPHDFGFFNAGQGYWNTMCDARSAAALAGALPGEVKQAVYMRGAALTADLLFKAAYEESLGRLMTMVRGEERAPLDTLSAGQAAAYAAFTASTPNGSWDHAGAAAALIEARTDAPRDIERMIALNIEHRAKGLIRSLVPMPDLPVVAREVAELAD